MEIKCDVVGKLTLVKGYDRGDDRCEPRWESGGALIKRDDDVHHLLPCDAVLVRISPKFGESAPCSPLSQIFGHCDASGDGNPLNVRRFQFWPVDHDPFRLPIF